MMARPKFPSPEVYVYNSPGCHGHYLTYLIDRLSRKTPDIKTLPFNKLGNSHVEINYSGFVEFVDSGQIPTTDLKGEKIIAIVYPNDLLYFERVVYARAADHGIDLHLLHNHMSFIKNINPSFYNKIRNLYGYQQDVDHVSKWAMRDAYKIGFLDQSRLGAKTESDDAIKLLETKVVPKNEVLFVEVNAFFDTKKLKATLQHIDNEFDIGLDYTELDYLHKEFMSRNKILSTAPYTDQVLNALENNKNIDIPDLDVIQQAFVYARIEERNDFISMPLTDNFFQTTQEIIEYLQHYPSHYKAMNPNLPKFNGIDNPFFLHRQKAK